MFKQNSWATVTAIIASAMFVSGMKAQETEFVVQSANSTTVVDDSCAPCNAVDSRGKVGGLFQGHSFGSFGKGGFHEWRDNFKAQMEHLGRINDLGTARNQAWPKPFACADRQVYFSIWEPMLNRGWKETCVLSDLHFDTATNQLNDAGKTKVAMIMRNNPVNQKSVFIARDRNQSDLDTRLVNVRNTVDQWYGLTNVNEIAFSDLTPMQGVGFRFATINKLSADGIAPPTIPVASGTGNTSTVESGN